MRRKLRYFMMFIGLLLCMSITAQTIKWRDIYTVKKKDTVFGIAKKYGLSLPELMEANPEMKQEGYMLQKGATLFIPYGKGEKNPNAPKDGDKAITTLPAIGGKPVVTGQPAVASNAVKIGVMLPLHDVDGDGKVALHVAPLNGLGAKP